MIGAIGAEKAFSKFQYPLMEKYSKIGNEGYFLHCKIYINIS